MNAYFEAFRRLNYPKDRLIINILENHPEGKTYEMIEKTWLYNKDFPFKIVLEKSGKNLGFTGGNNFVFKRLLKHSTAKFYFILNADTEIEPECIIKLVETMNADSSVGIVEAIQKPKEHPKYYDPVTLETGWCSGGGALIYADALREVGLFDDRFFLYCEDVDLSWRMWLKGWKCKINPEAAYIHYTEDQDQGKDLSNQHYFSMRNCFYMHFKYSSKRELTEHYKLFFSTIEKIEDPKLKEIFMKAFHDAQAKKKTFFWDRLKQRFMSKNQWVLFNEFSFEKRRAFKDTDDGKRIFL